VNVLDNAVELVDISIRSRDICGQSRKLLQIGVNFRRFCLRKL